MVHRPCRSNKSIFVSASRSPLTNDSHHGAVSLPRVMGRSPSRSSEPLSLRILLFPFAVSFSLLVHSPAPSSLPWMLTSLCLGHLYHVTPHGQKKALTIQLLRQLEHQVLSSSDPLRKAFLVCGTRFPHFGQEKLTGSPLPASAGAPFSAPHVSPCFLCFAS